MGFFAQADEGFYGDQPQREPERNGDIGNLTELQPGESGAIHADPKGLACENIGRGEVLAIETVVEKVDDGQGCAGQGENGEEEERPTRTKGG